MPLGGAPPKLGCARRHNPPPVKAVREKLKSTKRGLNAFYIRFSVGFQPTWRLETWLPPGNARGFEPSVYRG